MGCGFCESAVSNGVGTLLVDCVAKPMKAQLDYVRHYHENVEKFGDSKDELSWAQEKLERRIKEHDNNLLKREPLVLKLISDVKKTLVDMSSLQEEIQQNKKCFNCCPNWWWRYRLSRKLEKKILLVCAHIKKSDSYCEQKQLGSPVAIPTDVEFRALSKNFHVSKSSEKALKLVRSALRDENVGVIEVWGMGGVGKTTLVNEVGKEVVESKWFDKVVIVTISRNPNLETIQDEIAKDLSFNMKDDHGKRKGAKDLFSRLKNEKSILIILDDVWADIDLKMKIGIPVGEDPKVCKIILTTRRHSVCKSVNCKPEIIKLDFLDHQEALELFEKKTDLQNCNNEDIKKVAVEIVKECQGLPIALVTLGSALKGEESIDSWEAAYGTLKEHSLPNIEGIVDTEKEKNAYLCIAMSFDFLRSRETKICFLLCSLFPEDCEIYVEDLVRYAWGLKLYKGVDTIKKVRSNVLAAINTLKKSCLLLDAKERHVKIHDLVRDVALWISTSNYKNISFKIKSEVIEMWPMDDFQSYTAISLMTANEEVELPVELACPNLEILLLHGERASVPSKFFEGMETLKVCSLHGKVLSFDTYDHLPPNLRSLHLKYCELHGIPIVKMLKKLEILSFNTCDISDLPNEICELDNLRMLDLSNCRILKRIPPHWLSRLSRLEELHLDGCAKIRWTNDNATEQDYCASLSELSSLSGSIKVLSLEVSPNDVPKDFVFPELEWFNIRIVDGGYFNQFENCVLSRSRSLKVEGSSIHACKNLFKGVTSLEVIGCDEMQVLFQINEEVDSTNLSSDGDSSELRSIKVDHVSLQNLKVLQIVSCPKLTYLFSASMAKSLGRLETLKISDCMELEKIIQKTEASNICLQSLQGVMVERCHKLTSLSSLCHGQFLENLKKLEIDNCDGLEYTFPTSMAEGLPQLNTFTLSWSPKFNGNDILFTLSSLQELRVFCCTLLTPFIISAKVQVLCLTEITESEDNMNIKSSPMESLTITKLVDHLFDSTYNLSMLRELELSELHELQVIWKDPIQLQNFQCLAILDIHGCSRLRHVFSKAIAHNLQQLRSLKIECCMELEEIMEKGETSDSEQPIGFPNLTEIWIRECPKLKSVFPISVTYGLPKHELQVIWKDPIQLQNFQCLAELRIRGCLRLRHVFSKAIAHNLQQLRSLEIDDCMELEEIMEKGETSDSEQPIGFPNLTQIQIGRCPKLKSVFPISVLPKLEDLLIFNSNLEQVFEDVNLLNQHNNKIICLTELTHLWLEELPCLKRFIPIALEMALPSLGSLSVEGCPNMETSFSVDSKECVHIHTQTEPTPADQNIAPELAVSQQTKCWPIGSDIHWRSMISFDSELKSTLKEIKGDKDWWDTLDWKEPAIRRYFEELFTLVSEDDTDGIMMPSSLLST